MNIPFMNQSLLNNNTQEVSAIIKPRLFNNTNNQSSLTNGAQAYQNYVDSLLRQYGGNYYPPQTQQNMSTLQSPIQNQTGAFGFSERPTYMFKQAGENGSA